MAWWTVPAITIGAMLLVRTKGKAGKFRWIELTEEQVELAPIGLIMARVKSGEELPDPPPMTTWKPMQIAVAPSPFAAVQRITLHVLEKWQEGPLQQEPTEPIAGASDLGFFLTKEYLETAPVLGPGPRVGDLGQWWRRRRVMHAKKPYWTRPTPTFRPRVTIKPSPPRPRPTFRPRPRPMRPKPGLVPWSAPSAPWKPGRAALPVLRTQWRAPFRRSVMPGWQSFVSWGQQRGRPSILMGFGAAEDPSAAALKKAIEDTAAGLQALGAAMQPIDPSQIRPGDFVVGLDCKLYAVDAVSVAAPASVTELHPNKGVRGGLSPAEIQCAFGVRKTA